MENICRDGLSVTMDRLYLVDTASKTVSWNGSNGNASETVHWPSLVHLETGKTVSTREENRLYILCLL